MDLFELFILAVALIVFLVLLSNVNWARRQRELEEQEQQARASAGPEEQPGADEEIAALIASGRRFDAIQRVRQLKGMTREEATAYVDAQLRP